MRLSIAPLALAALSTLALTAARASGPAAARIVVPFIADDYELAVSEARARKVPIFIEAWAPW